MEQLKDVHFFHMTSQGNIYTIVDLPMANGYTKLLVASLKREVFCFEFQESSSGSLIPSSKEISFTYIPNGAEIISMDAFSKTNGHEFVIGITIIKNSSDSESRLDTYLNIYSGEETDEFNIENVAQSCLNVELNFIPYKLLHTYLVTWENDVIVNKEIVFVLSGSDNQVHIYKENTTDHTYQEIDHQEIFPEFCKTPSPVLWIDIYYFDDFSERVTSFCCECGYVKLLKVNVKLNKLVYNFSTRFGNSVSRVYISPQNKVKSNKSLENILPAKKTKKSINTEVPHLNLIVVNTILPGVIFHNILEYALSNYSQLPRLDMNSVMTCCEVVDLDLDGEKEILVGTSSEAIMLYKKDSEGVWWLEDAKKFTSPILGIKSVDMTGDGVKDLVILCMKGVQVLQIDHNVVQSKLKEKIENLIIPDISQLKI